MATQPTTMVELIASVRATATNTLVRTPMSGLGRNELGSAMARHITQFENDVMLGGTRLERGVPFETNRTSDMTLLMETNGNARSLARLARTIAETTR